MSIGNLTLTTLNMAKEAKEISELNLHKAVILGEMLGGYNEASILYPLCMKSGCFHCHMNERKHKVDYVDKPSSRKTLQRLQKTILANLTI